MASQSSAPGRSRPPTDDLEDWDVGSRIGKGSFATVFSGTHKVRFSALPRRLSCRDACANVSSLPLLEEQIPGRVAQTSSNAPWPPRLSI